MTPAGVITPFEYYSEISRLSYHSTNIFTSGFYNAIKLGKTSTQPN